MNEIFELKDFNIAYARQYTEEDIIISKKYEQLLSIKTHFMNKEDIIKLKKNRRDLRLKLKEIEKRVNDLVYKSNRPMKLISISSLIQPLRILNLMNYYSDKEIKISMTC